MEKDNSNPPMDNQSKEKTIIPDPMAPGDVPQAVVDTWKLVDGSKKAASFRDAASSSADPVETGKQNATLVSDSDLIEADEDAYWTEDEEDDLNDRLDVVAQVDIPFLQNLIAARPELAATFRDMGIIINANGILVMADAPQTSTEETSAAAAARRQALFTKAASAAVFPGGGTEEEDDGNDWYESIARDAQMLEQMEEPELQEMPLLPGTGGKSASEAPPPPPKEKEERRPSAAGGEDDGRELTLEDYCKIWGLHPSELEPDEEPGESSMKKRVAPLADDELAKFDCGICLETLPILDLFHGMQCAHKFCAHCMTRYIEGRIHEGGVSILCPDPACKGGPGGGGGGVGGSSNNGGGGGGVLNPEHCKKSIDFAAFCSWGDRLTEKAIPQHLRVYCPNPKCGLMFEKSSCGGAGGGNKEPCKASCPACNHLLCTTCGLDWVTEGREDGQHDCDEGKGAALVKELAAARHWKQCPSCKMMVDKIMGCNAMHCRCGCLFCYSCGLAIWPGLDGGGDLCQCANHHIHRLRQHGNGRVVNLMN